MCNETGAPSQAPAAAALEPAHLIRVQLARRTQGIWRGAAAAACDFEQNTLTPTLEADEAFDLCRPFVNCH